MKRILFGISMFVMFFFAIVLSSCGEKACVHSEEIIAGTAATCTESGLTEGKKCSLCQEILVAQETIEPLGHTEVEVEESDATCTENGNVAYTHCTVCDKNFDAEGNVLSDVVIPAGHKLTSVEEVPATCTNTGEAAHEHCTVCDKNFDAEGNVLNDLTISNLGHIDENLDVECDRDGCTAKIAPLADSEISLFTANNLGEKLSTTSKYYVSGVVSKVDDFKNGIFFIKDEIGEEFLLRLPVDENGISHANWESKIVVGDVVKFYGKCGKFTSANLPRGFLPCMQGAVLVERTHNHSYSDATCEVGPTCTCGFVNGDALPHEDKNNDGNCDGCDRSMTAKESSMIINTLVDDPNSGTLAANSLSRTWENEQFSVTVSNGTASAIYLTNDGFMKMRTGNELKVVAKEGVKISKIVITATSKTYGEAFATAFNALNGATATQEDTIITITFEEAIDNVAIKVGKSSRFSNIVVFYE